MWASAAARRTESAQKPETAVSGRRKKRPQPPRRRTWEELRLTIVVWIERTDYRRRRQRRPGKPTPGDIEIGVAAGREHNAGAKPREIPDCAPMRRVLL